MSLHFPPVQPSGWAVKQETGAKSKFWCLDRTKGDLCGWAALFCHIAAGFKLLALLPTRLALCVKARPSHHCFYHYNVLKPPHTIIIITNLNATKFSIDSWQNSISPNSYFLWISERINREEDRWREDFLSFSNSPGTFNESVNGHWRRGAAGCQSHKKNTLP